MANKDAQIIAQTALKAAVEAAASGITTAIKTDADRKAHVEAVAYYTRAFVDILNEVVDKVTIADTSTNTDSATSTNTDPVETVVRAFPGAVRVCPACGHDKVWDNREENKRRVAQGLKRRPDFKCAKCDWVQWGARTNAR